MSVKATSEADGADLNETEQQLEGYLLDEVDGLEYFKSRLIAEDLDLSSKSVGCNMRGLADCSTALDSRSGDIRVGRPGWSNGKSDSVGDLPQANSPTPV